MDNAFELYNYLPLSYRNRNEQDYIAFLWDAFETNYRDEKYPFALLAFHMLTMSAIYFNIWQIKLTMPKEFGNAMVGFDKNLGDELLNATTPFTFWRVNESRAMRFLKLVGCTDQIIGRCKSFITQRNDSVHANGNIYCNNLFTLDNNIDSVLKVLEDIEINSEPLINNCYISFLINSQNPEEREYVDDYNQIYEVLIKSNYFSQRDIDVCLKCDTTKFKNETGYANIVTLHNTLREKFLSDDT